MQSEVKLAGFSLRYPVTACMIFVSIVLLGVISTVKIPLVLFPDIDEPFRSSRFRIRTPRPGRFRNRSPSRWKKSSAPFPASSE